MITEFSYAQRCIHSIYTVGQLIYARILQFSVLSVALLRTILPLILSLVSTSNVLLFLLSSSFFLSLHTTQLRMQAPPP